MKTTIERLRAEVEARDVNIDTNRVFDLFAVEACSQCCTSSSGGNGSCPPPK